SDVVIDPQLRRPPSEALAWVAATMGRGATVRSVRRLHGGISSAVHRVTIETLAGARTTVVLRRWVGNRFGIDRSAMAQHVVDEQAALELVEPSPVPAPRVIAADAEGDQAGVPALLMSRLPGSIFLAPSDFAPWLHAVADTLGDIHALPIDDRIPAFTAYDFSSRAVPSDATRPELWRAANALGTREPPTTTPVFRHGDYQHFNLLWSREQLTGVVDWTFPSRGPAGLDVGHCMLNLAVLFSADAAAQFRARYEAVTASTVDPYWIATALSGYSSDWLRFIPVQVHGRAPVDTAGMTARVETALDAAMQALG
ncbi:MAG: phosphotransferase, partial [Acidimicrobiia bacterium]